jgi:high affinity Mn2+ porin
MRRILAALLVVLAAQTVAPRTWAQSFFNSPGVPNLGPPEAAIFPDLAAMQDRLDAQGWLLRGQATFILQGNAGFRSPYRGPNSLAPVANARNTLSTDLVLGRRLWAGAEAILDVAVTRGYGLSNSVGVAGFPNNEAFRLGSTAPVIYVPRAFIRQTFALSADTIAEEADPMRFPGPLPRERITLTIGKFSVWDIFDDNRYAHDARTQFLNWALVGAGGFDYAADARGWTNGVALEWDNGTWGLRAGAFQVARRANGLFLDPALTRAFQILGEVDRFWSLGDRPGAARVILGLSSARMSTWRELDLNGFGTFDQNPAGYRRKTMLALNMEQALTRDLGAFLRLSWNDGRTNNWMFTEMDRAISFGLSLAGRPWDRPADTLGLATNIGFISKGRQAYLAAGGIGFIVGDGRLSYAPEWVTEVTYDARVAAGLNMALNWQLVVNPAYNADRGPVSIVALRMRTAF